MVRSSKRSGHSPFKAGMLGSSPARITITMGYSQVAKAPVFDIGITGSNPARISTWSLRLVGQDASLRAALRAVARLHSAAALIKLEIRVRSTD